MISTVDEWLVSLHLTQYTSVLLQAGYTSLRLCSQLTSEILDSIGINLIGHKKRILAHLPNIYGQLEDISDTNSGIYDRPLPAFTSENLEGSNNTKQGYVNVDSEGNIITQYAESQKGQMSAPVLSGEDAPPLPPKLRTRLSNESLMSGLVSPGGTLGRAFPEVTPVIPVSPPCSPPSVKKQVPSAEVCPDEVSSTKPVRSVRAAKPEPDPVSDEIYGNAEKYTPENSDKEKFRPKPKPRNLIKQATEIKNLDRPKPTPRPRSKKASRETDSAAVTQSNDSYEGSEKAGSASSLVSSVNSSLDELTDMEKNSLYIGPDYYLSAPMSEQSSNCGEYLQMGQIKINIAPATFDTDVMESNPVYSGNAIRPEPDGADSPDLKPRVFDSLISNHADQRKLKEDKDDMLDETKPKTAHYALNMPEDHVYSELPEEEPSPGSELYEGVWNCTTQPKKPKPKHGHIDSVQDKNANIVQVPLMKKKATFTSKGEKKPLTLNKSQDSDDDSDVSLEEPTFAPPPLPKDYSTSAFPSLPPRPAQFRPTPLALILQGSKEKLDRSRLKSPGYDHGSDSFSHSGDIGSKDPFMALATSRTGGNASPTSSEHTNSLKPSKEVKEFDPLYQSKSDLSPAPLHSISENVYTEAGQSENIYTESGPAPDLEDGPVYEGITYEEITSTKLPQKKHSLDSATINFPKDKSTKLDRTGSFGPAERKLERKGSFGAPPPPPRKVNPFQKFYDRESGLYHITDDTASGTSVWESDDTLSDGGDFMDEDEPDNFLGKPFSNSVIPIVPATPTKSLERAEYLYKQASKHSKRNPLGWMKRWVVFDGKSIKWFSHERSKVSKRIIPTSTMKTVEVELANSDRRLNMPNCFKVVTVDRMYWFAAESADIATLWASTIMQGIISAKDSHTSHRDGGEMYMPDKQGYLRIEGIKGKRYLAIKKDKFCYYNTYNDFKAGSPIHCVEMKIATVKDGGRNKMEIITPYAKYIFVCESQEELMEWKMAFEVAIAEGLADDFIMEQVYENHSNRFCADCGAPDPHWASINFGITLCQHCAGVHRMLKDPPSKIRSLRMDHRVWTPRLIKLLKSIGNDNSNRFWEWHTTAEIRIDSDVDMPKRKDYILNKYEKKMYCKFDPMRGDTDALNTALRKSVQYDDVQETLSLIYSGAQISHVFSPSGSERQTPLQIAKSADQELQVEFLVQNGAEEHVEEAADNDINQMMEKRSHVQIPDVTCQGYLHKTGPNQKDFLRRWCVLKNGILNYYESESNVVAKDNVTNREMLVLTKTSTDKFPYAFEISTRKFNSRIYLFAADTESSRKEWLIGLSKVLAMSSTLPCEDFDRAGLIHLKMGATDEWQRTWIQLNGTTLHICDKRKQDYEKVDLRQLANMQFLRDDPAACQETLERGSMFVVDVPGANKKAVYIQADLQRDTDDWYKYIHEAATLTGGTLEEQQLTADGIPVLVEKCVNHVAMYGLTEDGIYRKAGQERKVKQLLAALKKDARNTHIRPEDYEIHEVTNALRRFLRGLEEPLFTNRLYQQWIDAARCSDQNEKVKLYQNLLPQLPYVNMCTLKRLVFHLADVAEHSKENKMTPSNLAVVFSPALFAVDSQASSQGYMSNTMELTVVGDLLTHHQVFFKRRDTELERERKIKAAIKKMEDVAVLANTPPAGDFIVGVKLKGKDGWDDHPVKVPLSRIAGELVDQMIASHNLSTDKNWGLFEVVCDETLERPLHPSERVMDVTMRWSTWHTDYCVGNHLCLKENVVYDKLEVVFDPQLSLFSELKLSDKRNFKKYYFEFSQARLSYQKAPNAHEPEASWEVENLLVYLGVPVKRTPPTRFGFTFITLDEDLSRSGVFGRSICCNNEEELYRWLAGMLHAKHPHGLKSRTGTQAQAVSMVSPTESLRKTKKYTSKFFGKMFS